MPAEGFEEWYIERHRRVVVSLAAHCGDLELAHDAASEAFARAFAHWDRVRVMPSPAGWVYRVGLNMVRRAARRRALEARFLRRELPRPAELHSYPEVWAAVRSLPERQRQAVVLRFVADLAEADIAVAMGVSRGTVASTLSDARHRLAGLLGDPSPTEAI